MTFYLIFFCFYHESEIYLHYFMPLLEAEALWNIFKLLLLFPIIQLWLPIAGRLQKGLKMYKEILNV